jgi:SOS-response transcriptional repressor LexA
MKSTAPTNAEIIKALEESGWTQSQIATAIVDRGQNTTQATISRIKKGAKTNSDLSNALRDLAVEQGVLPDQGPRAAAPYVDFIDEIDVRAGMGGGGISIIENETVNGIQISSESVRDHWRLPGYMLNRLNARASHIKAFPCQGDSMAPTIMDGDVVFADTRHQVPSPPGVYVMADEFGGVVIKRVEVISRPSDEIVTVRISSDNPNHRDREMSLTEIHIIGRYVGRFTT